MLREDHTKLTLYVSLEVKKKVENPVRKAIPALKTRKPTHRLRHQSIPVNFFLIATDGAKCRG